MSQKITVIAKVYPKKEYFKDIKDMISKNVEKAKREIGNIEYGLYVERSKEHELVVIEKWETEADYMRHKKSEYISNFDDFTKGKIEKDTDVELYNYIKG
jgi:quinol monooxygenase YgiN